MAIVDDEDELGKRLVVDSLSRMIRDTPLNRPFYQSCRTPPEREWVVSTTHELTPEQFRVVQKWVPLTEGPFIDDALAQHIREDLRRLVREMEEQLFDRSQSSMRDWLPPFVNQSADLSGAATISADALQTAIAELMRHTLRRQEQELEELLVAMGCPLPTKGILFPMLDWEDAGPFLKELERRYPNASICEVTDSAGQFQYWCWACPLPEYYFTLALEWQRQGRGGWPKPPPTIDANPLLYGLWPGED